MGDAAELLCYKSALDQFHFAFLWESLAMALAIDQGVCQALHGQLLARNNVEVHVFEGLVQDWQSCWRQLREAQVRNVQLDQEAQELRTENNTLAAAAQQSKMSEAAMQQMATHEGRIKELQEELTTAYKEKGKLAEDLLQATSQLQVVRETNEQQGKQLTDAGQTERELRARVKELAAQVDHERAAHALASSELEARLADKEAAEARATKLETENGALVQRLIQLKATEVERMNEVNRVCEEMLENARHMQRAAAVQTQQSARSLKTRSQSMGTPPLREQLGNLSLPGVAEGGPSDAVTLRAVPTQLAKAVPAHDGGCLTCAFDRSGTQMASGGANKVVRIWDVATATPTSTLHGMQESVLECCFTADSTRLLAAGGDQNLRLWEIESRRERHTLTGHTAKVSTVDCCPMDASKAASGGTDRCIKLWDLNRGFNRGTFLFTSTCNSLRYLLDGAALVSGHWDGALRFWDLRSGRVAHEVTGLHVGQICSVGIGRRTGQILTAGKDNLLKLVDSRTFEVRQTFRAPGFAVGTVWCTACMSPDERHVAAGSASGAVYVWEVDKGTVVKELGKGSGGGQPVQATAWSPQGQPLVSCDKAGAVSFWRD